MARPGIGLAALAALICLAFAPLAEATFPGKNGRIAFALRTSSNDPLDERDIWTVNPDGSDPRRLTDAARWDILPDWSPDASKIAFVSTRDNFNEAVFHIWVMNADGSEQRRLTQDGFLNYSPTWSPDGTQIAYTRARFLGGNLYNDLIVMNADGSDQHRVVGGNTEYVWEPSWSPDGQRIAYSEWQYPDTHSIWTVRPDGSERQQVISVPGHNIRAPDWSPDGTTIAFSVPRDAYFYDVWASNSDGSGEPRQLAEMADMPSWSPDGTQIAFSRWTNPLQQAWVMNADGSHQRPIAFTGDASFISRPDWAAVPPPRRSDYKNAAQFCKAEQTFWGDQFASRYGGGPNAYGKCVSRK